jgi:hypothetical protein
MAHPERFKPPTMTRATKITLGEMRSSGVRGLLIYCSDYRCSHSTEISADGWPDEMRLSDLEHLFSCTACGTKGADVRPDFHWNLKQASVKKQQLADEPTGPNDSHLARARSI